MHGFPSSLASLLAGGAGTHGWMKSSDHTPHKAGGMGSGVLVWQQQLLSDVLGNREKRNSLGGQWAHFPIRAREMGEEQGKQMGHTSRGGKEVKGVISSEKWEVKSCVCADKR